MSFKQLIFACVAVLALGATVPESPISSVLHSAVQYIKQTGFFAPLGL